MIQENISSIVSQMVANGNVFSFLHSDSDFQNLAGDQIALPAVFLDMPVKYKPIVRSSGQMDVEFSCIVAFLYKSELDQTANEKYNIFKKCMAAQREFQLLLENNTEMVRSISVAECYQVQNIFDCNLDAVVMPFNIMFNNFESTC